MGKITGRVQQVQEKDTNFGTMYNIRVEGVYYGCGRDRPAVQEGDTVSFLAVDKGRFKNVQGEIEVLSSPGPSAAPASGSSGSSYDSRQLHIEFQSSRSVAAQLTQTIVQAVPDKGWDEESIVALYDQLKWKEFEEIEQLDELLANR